MHFFYYVTSSIIELEVDMKLIQIINHAGPTQKIIEAKRVAIRAIIFKDEKLMMIQSKKVKEYKFPGGGKLPNESHIETLIRETKEETGLSVILDSVKPYGYVKEIRNSIIENDQAFEMDSYYYICSVESEIKKTNLDTYEMEYGYQLKIVSIDEAINQNENCLNQMDKAPWIYRELIVLRDLKEYLLSKGKQDEII
jgi:8-oxo-dGTP diphosphatase